MDSVITPWAVELALITWRSVRKKSRPPLPSEFLATFIVFGGFTVVSRVNPRIGAGLGWGIVIATFLNLYGTEDKLTDPFSKTSGKADNAKTVGPVAVRTSGDQ